MIQVKEAIIVEGIYDKIKLSRFIDGVIFVTGGFSVIKDKKRMTTIKSLAEKTGIVILTDSDTAGFKIRNFIKQNIPKADVKHAYIPEILGKEKRKKVAGKEGLLGVEGMREDVILDALKKAGCEIEGVVTEKKQEREITKADMYMLGLSGGEGSARLRKILEREIGIPSKISANMLLDVLNRLFSLEELTELVESIITNS